MEEVSFAADHFNSLFIGVDDHFRTHRLFVDHHVSETFTFSLTLGKKIDGVITLLRQFTNNYFKIGYFKPIHTISIELFKQVESSTFEHIVRIIENHVLFYLMHCNLGGKNSSNVTTDQNNSTTQTSSGFHPNGTIPSSVPCFPYLPPIDTRKDIYTLVLDLDETLVHYFYVSDLYVYNIYNIDTKRRQFFNKTLLL